MNKYNLCKALTLYFQPTYDIVVSAFTLFELPGTEARLEAILRLWQKTEHYLVIVEQGTNTGYTVGYAKRFLLFYSKNSYPFSCLY